MTEATIGHNQPPSPIDLPTDEKGAIVLVENLPVEAIFKGGLVGELLEHIQQIARGLEPDTSTKAKRALIAGRAARISSTKTALDGAGKAMVDGIKKEAGEIDAVRKTIRDTLDALRDEIRKPLSDIEDAEKALHDAITAKVRAIHERADVALTSSAMQEALDGLEGMQLTEAEYGAQLNDAAIARDAAIGRVSSALRRIAADEDSRAKAKAERDRLAAEEKAAAERRSADALAKQKTELEAAAAERISAAEQKAADALKDAEERARLQIEADRKRVAAEQAERERQEKVEAKAAADRAADKAHRGDVNTAALKAFMENVEGITRDQAKQAVIAIIGGKIPAVRLEY